MFKFTKSMYIIPVLFILMLFTLSVNASINSTNSTLNVTSVNNTLINDFTIEQVSNTSCILKWNLDTKIDALNLRYGLHDDESFSHASFLSLDPTINTTLISNLKTNSSYDIVLQASSGDDNESSNLLVTTLSNSQQGELNSVIRKADQLKTQEYTDASWAILLGSLHLPQIDTTTTAYKIDEIDKAIFNLVQIAPVTNFSVNHITNNSVQLFWHPAPWVNTLQLTYKADNIFNNSTNNSTFEKKNIEKIDLHTNTITISTLKPNTSYLFTLNSTFNNSNAIVNSADMKKIKVIVNANGDLVYVTDLKVTTLSNDKTDQLFNVKSSAHIKKADNYTNSSWTPLINALNMVETNQFTVDSKIMTINEALMQLVTVEDALSTHQIRASNLTSHDYTNDTWSKLDLALNMQNETKVEMKDKTTAIEQAITSLITIHSHEELQKVQNNAHNLSAFNYTTNSWYILQSALDLSQKTESEVITKTNVVNNAVNHLIKKSTYLQYMQLTQNLSALSSSNYSVQSWNNLSDIQSMPISNEAELQTKILSLNTARNNLITSDTAYELDLSKTRIPRDNSYTVASWLNMTNAMNLPENNQSAVTIKTHALNTALNKLVILDNSGGGSSTGTASISDTSVNIRTIVNNSTSQNITSTVSSNLSSNKSNSSSSTLIPKEKTQNIPGFGILMAMCIFAAVFAVSNRKK